MKALELINKLSGYPDDLEVMVHDVTWGCPVHIDFVTNGVDPISDNNRPPVILIMLDMNGL